MINEMLIYNILYSHIIQLWYKNIFDMNYTLFNVYTKTPHNVPHMYHICNTHVAHFRMYYKRTRSENQNETRHTQLQEIDFFSQIVVYE